MGILNPHTFASKYVENWQESDITCNGIDIRVSRLYLLDDTSTGRVNGSTRQFMHRTAVPLLGDEYILHPRKVYEFESNLKIRVPEDAAGFVIHRSSLLRNGILVTSGVYDAGFSGGLNGYILPQAGLVAIGQNERVGQLVMFSADSYKQYNGIYQGTNSVADVLRNKDGHPL